MRLVFLQDATHDNEHRFSHYTIGSTTLNVSAALIILIRGSERRFFLTISNSPAEIDAHAIYVKCERFGSNRSD